MNFEEEEEVTEKVMKVMDFSIGNLFKGKMKEALLETDLVPISIQLFDIQESTMVTLSHDTLEHSNGNIGTIRGDSTQKVKKALEESKE